MVKSKVKFIHFASLAPLLSVNSCIDLETGKVVVLTDDDKINLCKETAAFLAPDGIETFLGFIFLDNNAQSQRYQFETDTRVKLSKGGLDLELVHESPYFCNRGYHYGNVLQFALFKVKKHEL